MKTSVQDRADDQDMGMNVEAVLARFDPYIMMLARETIRRNTHITHSALLDLDLDELAQRVRIKFWRALSERRIEYARAYIKQIVRTEFIDMLRSKRPLRSQPLPVDEEGELYQGNMLITLSIGMSDPAVEIEDYDVTAGRMNEVIDAILQLPPRQQHVIVCSLRDHVDDPQQFERIFNARQEVDVCSASRTDMSGTIRVDISSLQWPVNKAERQLLLASLSAARQNIARGLADVQLTKKAIHRAKKGSRKARVNEVK